MGDCRFSSIRTRETNIGNLIADVMRAGLKTDIAALNSGTLRSDAIIEKGPFKVRDLVKLLPMLDELCVLQLSGEQVMLVLENSVSQYPRLEGRFLQVSGVEFTFDADKPSGQRVIKDTVMVRGQPIDGEKNTKLPQEIIYGRGRMVSTFSEGLFVWQTVSRLVSCQHWFEITLKASPH